MFGQTWQRIVRNKSNYSLLFTAHKTAHSNDSGAEFTLNGLLMSVMVKFCFAKIAPHTRIIFSRDAQSGAFLSRETNKVTLFLFINGSL